MITKVVQDGFLVFVHFDRPHDMEPNSVYDYRFEDRANRYIFIPNDFTGEKVHIMDDIPEFLLEELYFYENPCEIYREDVPQGVIL